MHGIDRELHSITRVQICQERTAKQEEIEGVQGVCKEMIKIIFHGLHTLYGNETIRGYV